MSTRTKMVKRVERKDDGRALIYYTFERSDAPADHERLNKYLNENPNKHSKEHPNEHSDEQHRDVAQLAGDKITNKNGVTLD